LVVAALLTFFAATRSHAQTIEGSSAAPSAGGLSSAGIDTNQAALGQVASRPIRGGVYSLNSGHTSRLIQSASEPIDPSAPVISEIPDQIIVEDERTEIIPFTYGDPDTPLARLTLTRESSNL
jgi:hypothetical protein